MLLTEWQALPIGVRNDIRARTQMRRSGVVEVCDNEVINDGVLQKDLDRVSPARWADVIGPEKTSDKFCEFCASRGVRHKKECTRPQ